MQVRPAANAIALIADKEKLRRVGVFMGETCRLRGFTLAKTLELVFSGVVF